MGATFFMLPGWLRKCADNLRNCAILRTQKTAVT